MTVPKDSRLNANGDVMEYRRYNGGTKAEYRIYNVTTIIR